MFLTIKLFANQRIYQEDDIAYTYLIVHPIGPGTNAGTGHDGLSFSIFFRESKFKNI